MVGGVHQELDRPGALVSGGARDAHRSVGDPPPQVVVDDGRRGLLDQLLIAPLERAVPLAQERDVAVRVGQDLGLDVVGSFDVSLEVHLGPAEVRAGLARRALDGLAQLRGGAHQPHALPASTERGLDHQGEADPVGRSNGLLGVDGVRRPRDDRRPRPGRHRSRGDLVSHRRHGLGRRADEGEAGGPDRPGEVGVLGQEAVPGVDVRGLRPAGHVQDPLDVQVRPIGVIGHLGVHRVAIGVGVHGHGGDGHLPARPDDADGDLSPVGDEHAKVRHR